MTSRLAAGAAALLGLLLTQPAFAQDAAAEHYSPASAWSVDYGDDYCRLARSFTSEAGAEVALALERIQAAPLMRLILVGQGLSVYRSAQGIGYRFLPEGATMPPARFARSETAEGQVWLNLGSVSLMPREFPAPGEEPKPFDRAAEQEAAGQVTGISFEGGLTTPITLETGSLKQPIAALQACADELLTHWELDAAAHQQMSRPAYPDGGTTGWIPTGTIGFGDFDKLTGSANEIRLMIDASGNVTGCQVHWPSLSHTTNRRLCDSLTRNAKFKPALDANGEPMASYFTTSPFFLLPPPPGAR